MLRVLSLAIGLLAGADALHISAAAPSRSSAITMGLSAGDKMPASVLKTCGVSGKKGVIFFYGADDAPSCSKEITAFDAAAAEFKDAGVAVVGVRNAAGVKDSVDAAGIKLVVDDADSMREEIGIEKDLFGLLGGRETYVFDGSGTIVGVHNNQFDPKSHVDTALAAIEDFPKSSSPLDGFFAQIQSALQGAD